MSGQSYATKERVWKRLGLAVIEDERQQRRSNPEQAAAHGYSPRRRAEIWTIADSMFRHQWNGAKEGREAGPVGRYGEVYQSRKLYTATREWTPAHRDNDARRVMTKALIEDLWRAWRQCAAAMEGDMEISPAPRRPDRGVGTPFSQVSGRPGTDRYAEWLRISASWGYP